MRWKKAVWTYIKTIWKKIKRKYASLSKSQQTIIVWSIVGIISLFFPWIVDNTQNGNIKYNSFNAISWNIWYILIILLIIQIFLTLSNNYKEKMKLYSDIDLKNHFIVIITWVIHILLGIIAINFAVWLSIISQYMTFGEWPIISIVWWIVVIVWWIYLRIEHKNNSSEIILEKLSQNREKNKQKENMELPF